MFEQKRVKIISKPIMSVTINGVEHKYDQPVIAEGHITLLSCRYGILDNIVGFSFDKAK